MTGLDKKSELTKHAAWILPILFFCLACFHSSCQMRGNLDAQLPFSIYMYGDTDIYLANAMSIRTGNFADPNLLFHPPFTGLVLAGILRAGELFDGSGAWKRILIGLHGVVAALSVLIAGRIRRSIFFPSMVGVCVSFSFALAVLSTVPGTEALYLCLSLWAVFLLLRKTPHSWKSATAIGVMTGLACLTRQEHLLLIPAAALFAGRTRTGWDWKIIFIVSLSALATLIPTTIHNYHALQSINAAAPELDPLPVIAPVTIYGPLNFALANLPPATGEFTRKALPRVKNQDNLLIFHPEHRVFLTRGYRMGLTALARDPGRAIRLMTTKVSIAWEALALGYTSGNFPHGLKGARRPVDLFAPEHVWFGAVMTILALCGGWALRTYAPKIAVLMTVIVLHRLCVITLFFGYVRQGALLIPYILIIAVLFIHGFATRFIQSKRLLAAALTALILSGVVCDWRQSRTQRSFQINYNTLPGSNRIDQQLRVEFIPNE